MTNLHNNAVLVCGVVVSRERFLDISLRQSEDTLYTVHWSSAGWRYGTLIKDSRNGITDQWLEVWHPWPMTQGMASPINDSMYGIPDQWLEVWHPWSMTQGMASLINDSRNGIPDLWLEVWHHWPMTWGMASLTNDSRYGIPDHWIEVWHSWSMTPGMVPWQLAVFLQSHSQIVDWRWPIV